MNITGRILWLSATIVTVFVGSMILKPAFVTGSPECSEYEFPCDNGDCIDARFWCDSVEDCSDGSDEKYCRKAGLFNRDPNNCTSNYFRCSNGPCIPIIGRCNGFPDCEDSSDERNCVQPSSTPKSDAMSSPIYLLSETKTTTMIPTTTTHATTHQPTIKLKSQTYHSSVNINTMLHNFQNLYSDLRLSDYSNQIQMARNWLLSQRGSDFGWGDETPRALTALYLSDVQSVSRNESDMLMVKQLELQISLAITRNKTKAMKLTKLALYINALTASCKDAKNFYGENLVQTLRNGVDAAHRSAEFINPSVYLTLCINNATTYDDTRKLHDIFTSRNVVVGRIDIQALAMLAVTCIFRNTNFLPASMKERSSKQFIQRVKVRGLPGNVYEAALIAQALHEMKLTQPGLLEFMLKQQQEDGSFGGILATYLVLPVLAGRSFLQMNDHCDQRYSTDLTPLEVLKNSKRRKIYIQYALNYGNPPEISQMIQMQVAEGINFLDVMRLAQEINPKYRFLLDGHRDNPVVYSIGGIPNDAENGMFWTLHWASNSNRTKGDAVRLTPYSGNIKELIPHPGDEFVFWMRYI